MRQPNRQEKFHEWLHTTVQSSPLAPFCASREIGLNHSLHRLPCFLNLPPEAAPQIPRNGRFVQPQLPRREILPVRLHMNVDRLPLPSRDALQQSIVQVVNGIRDQIKGFVAGDQGRQNAGLTPFGLKLIDCLPSPLKRFTPGKYIDGLPVRLRDLPNSNTNPKLKGMKVPPKVQNHSWYVCRP